MEKTSSFYAEKSLSKLDNCILLLNGNFFDQIWLIGIVLSVKFFFHLLSVMCTKNITRSFKKVTVKVDIFQISRLLPHARDKSLNTQNMR